MKKLKYLAFVCFVAALSSAHAQSNVPISASSITDSFNVPLPVARLCFTPVNATNTPSGFRVGSVQVVPNETCGKVTAGVLQGSLSVKATPTGIFYHIYAKASNSNVVLRDFGMTPITGASWTLDNYDPNLAVLPVSAISVGTITTLPAGSAGSCTITGSGPYLLNCSVPQGVQGIPGSTSLTGSTGDFAVPGNLAVAGSVTGSSLDGIQFVDGVTNTTVQQAINKLSGNGGNVYVPCGSYPGPTSIPSFTHVISACKASPASPALIGNVSGIVGNFASSNYAPSTSLNSTIFTYAATVTPVFKAFGVEIRGITFDFGGHNAGLIIQGSTGGIFDFTVQNCGGSANVTPCFQFLSYFNTVSDYFNSAENDFQRIAIETVPFGGSPGGVGMYIAGTGPAETSAVTNNFFRSVRVSNVKTGIQFAGNDDSNDFGHVYIGVNTSGGVGNAVAVNCGNALDQGDSGEHFQFLETDYSPGSPTTAAAICLGAETAFTVDNFELGGGWTTSTELATNVASTYYIKKHYDIPGGTAAHDSISMTGSIKLSGDSSFSANPRTIWATFIPSVGNASGTIQNFWIPDKAITITHITVFITGVDSAGCTTAPTFFVRDATASTSSATAVVPNATNNVDGGVIAFNVPGGHQLQLQSTAAGCTTAATNANVLVQYRMQ